MYVTSQPQFLNAVAELRTGLSANDLLSSLKRIELELGRLPEKARYGPRPVDLDIVLYNSDVINVDSGRLQVPHPRLHEREFVLQPLCDIDDSVPVPSADSPGKVTPARELLKTLRFRPEQRVVGGELTRVLPLRHSSRGLIEWSGPAKLMGIVNATPDSFSDGGQFMTISSVLARCEEFVRYGFDFVDVGGQSTRPGAVLVSADEEACRVVKLIGAIRKEFPSLAISIDTFRATVASDAVDAGADLVNDVSAGHLDPNMVHTVLEKRCPWALMHMRGTPETMMSAEMTDYGEEGVLAVCARELQGSIALATAQGVPRWDVILDPGYGFAKKVDQSIGLARQFSRWKDTVGGFPSLVGLSRKSSLASIVTRLREEVPESRDFATAGAVVAAMYAGADVLRVHNPAVADTIAVAHEMRCVA